VYTSVAYLKVLRAIFFSPTRTISYCCCVWRVGVRRNRSCRLTRLLMLLRRVCVWRTFPLLLQRGVSRAPWGGRLNWFFGSRTLTYYNTISYGYIHSTATTTTRENRSPPLQRRECFESGNICRAITTALPRHPNELRWYLI